MTNVLIATLSRNHTECKDQFVNNVYNIIGVGVVGLLTDK